MTTRGHHGLMLAGAAGGSGEYQYIRLLITANNGNAYTGLNELILRTSAGGTNYPAPPTNVATSPGDAATRASASESYFNNPPQRAFDKNYGTANSWYNNAGSLPVWLKWTFPAPVEIVEFVIIRAPGEEAVASRWPKDFKLQGSNDDSVWDDLKTVTGETGWGSGTYQARTYSVP